MLLTTLCYLEQDDKYLMLHRISKKNDVNKDKWIGIGGHFEVSEASSSLAKARRTASFVKQRKKQDTP